MHLYHYIYSLVVCQYSSHSDDKTVVVILLILSLCTELFPSWTMLRLRAHASRLTAIIEYISCRHARFPRLLHCVGQIRHQSTSSKSVVSKTADTEYIPIKKLLVANRGTRCSLMLMHYISVIVPVDVNLNNDLLLDAHKAHQPENCIV